MLSVKAFHIILSLSLSIHVYTEYLLLSVKAL